MRKIKIKIEKKNKGLPTFPGNVRHNDSKIRSSPPLPKYIS